MHTRPPSSTAAQARSRTAQPVTALRTRRDALLAFAVAVLTTGCGQRGPLYLPDEAPSLRRPGAEPQSERQDSIR